jgi:hypothetical protein
MSNGLALSARGVKQKPWLVSGAPVTTNARPSAELTITVSATTSSTPIPHQGAL